MPKRDRRHARNPQNRPLRPRPAAARGEAPSSPTPHHRIKPRPWSLLLLAVATCIAYAPAYRGPFLLDDIPTIQQNTTIQRLWPPSAARHSPPNTAVTGRPVVSYSLAVNYAINAALGVDQRADPNGRYKTVSYHVVNVLLHLLCGLLLYGVVWRTVAVGAFDASWTESAERLALVVAGLWLLNPVQTEAVNYIVQRTELIVTACYLGTLYAAIRAWTAENRRRRWSWYALGICACFLGMASKEVMFTAPLVIVLYDRTFHRRTWGELLHSERGYFYAALAGTSTWVVASIVRGARSETIGFNLGLPWYEYLYTQAWAIPHYVRLAFWPDRLVLDYGQRAIGGTRPLAGLVVLVLLLCLSIVAWVKGGRWRWLGFAGASFFLILAPSSSFVPIRTEIAADRRIYLALALVFTVLVVGAEFLRRRVASAGVARAKIVTTAAAVVAIFYLAVTGWTAELLAHAVTSLPAGQVALEWSIRLAIAVVTGALAWRLLVAARPRAWVGGIIALSMVATFARCMTFAHADTLWRDVLAKMPENARAYDNLADLDLAGSPRRVAEAIALLHDAIREDSTYANAWERLAQLAVMQGKPAQADSLLSQALVIDTGNAELMEQLGDQLVHQGDDARAIPLLEQAAVRYPNAECYVALGTAYMASGRAANAVDALRRATVLDSTRVDALEFLGSALLADGQAAEAVPTLEAAVAKDSGSASAIASLSLAYAEAGRSADAAAAARAAAVRAGNDAEIYAVTGRAMMIAGRPAEAEPYLARAIVRSPDDPLLLTWLGATKIALGQRSAGLAFLDRALRLSPGFAPAERALHLAQGAGMPIPR